jgi:hypothetical protein
MASGIDLLFSSNEQKEHVFDFKGAKIKVKTKEISWSLKNKILGDCFDYKSSGSARFDFDTYGKKMLAAVVVSISVDDAVVPQSDMTEVFFARLNPEFGSLLEKVIPKAFEDGSQDFFAKG